MDSSILHIALYVLGGCVVGASIAWSAIKKNLDAVSAQRDEAVRNYNASLSVIESQKEANAELGAELKSISEKSRILARNVITLRSEREKTKVKVSAVQNALASMRQKSSVLQSEFEKAREFYKRELTKSFEKRKALEQEVEKTRTKQESLANMIESSVLKHGSAENMLNEAHLRLGQLDVLRRNVNKLEAENEELRRDALRLKQELDAKGRELRTLDELKLHNQQLIKCVEALENSRQEQEADAEHYRQRADDSEKESDTLRLKLDDLEKNFADIEEQQHKAIEDVRDASVIPMVRKQL